MDRTEFFPYTIDPVRVGAYEGDTGPVYWDGKNWFIVTDEEVYSGEFDLASQYQIDKVSLSIWRGLTEEAYKNLKEKV